MIGPGSDLRSLFCEALDRPTVREQSEFLDQACAGRPDLRARVEALLHAHREGVSFLGEPVGDARATGAFIPFMNGASPAETLPMEAVGTVIGPYKLLEQIGEGGFGVVFMAEQQEPVRRRVALKVIKPGMDSRQVIARFEAERQALALMDHPNIARVLDAGTTAEPDASARGPAETLAYASGSAGRPYFVMELVRGLSMTEYCDQNNLAIRDRLELFIDVCQAVQHAHQKGIIHRDIKPSNVMATLQDGKPVVKVIDFGIAKALGQQLTDKTLFTNLAQMIGTPLYMSPEQAELSGLDVDTRSDIYSLGVLLYELLTGTTPFDKKRFKEVSYDEMRRIIREEEPPKPSTRMSQCSHHAPREDCVTPSGTASVTRSVMATIETTAEKRQSDARKLSRLFRGELDWIVMRALEKDRNRRYESASAFAADVQRYLSDEPVLACPPSAIYRLRKVVRRHRGAFLAASIIFLSLVGGILGTSWGLARAETAWQEEALRADGEQKAKEAAQKREAEKQAVLEFVEKHVFAAARPVGDIEGLGLGHDVTLRRAVEAALPFVNKSFADQPLIEARLRLSIGKSFQDLGESRTAAEQFESARAIYVKELGPDHADTVTSMNLLASSYMDLGRLVDALKLNEEVLARRKANLGPDDRDTLMSMNNLGNNYDELGRQADALKLREEVLALRKAKLGPDVADTIASMVNLGISYTKLARHNDALELEKETLSIAKAKLGPNHRWTLNCMISLAETYTNLGRHDEAIRLSKEALTLDEDALGPDHDATLSTVHTLILSYTRANQPTEALKFFEDALEVRKEKFGTDHPSTVLYMRGLAYLYVELGRFADALKLHEEMLTLQKAKLGPDHRDTLNTMHNIAVFYGRLGRRVDALTLSEKTLALEKAKLGADDLLTLFTMHNLACIYESLGRHSDAIRLIEETLALYKAKLGPEHPKTLEIMDDLAHRYGGVHQDADALKLREEMLALRKANLGPDHPLTRTADADAHAALGRVYYAKGQLDDAIAAYREAIKLKADFPEAYNYLGLALQAKGQTDDAIATYEEAIRLKDAAVSSSKEKWCAVVHFNLGISHWMKGQKDRASASWQEAIRLDKDYASAHYNLGCVLQAEKKPDEAIAAYKEAIRIKADYYCEALTNLGILLCKKGQLDEAIECFEQAIRFKDSFRYKIECAEAYEGLGEALQTKGRWAESITAYREACNINPRECDSLKHLAWILATCPDVKLRDSQQAVKNAKKAVELLPGESEVWNTLGVAQYRNGDWKAAVEAFTKSVELKKAVTVSTFSSSPWPIGNSARKKKLAPGSTRVSPG
jgi:serine/threonine protein kinase/tetratricopeptide (TPR) repeat protein